MRGGDSLAVPYPAVRSPLDSGVGGMVPLCLVVDVCRLHASLPLFFGDLFLLYFSG